MEHVKVLNRKPKNQEEIAEREKRNIINRPNIQTQPQKKTTAKKLPPPVPPKKSMVVSKQAQAEPITGYANIYRMKLGKMPNGNQDSRLQLNHVVSQARKQV